MAKVTLSKDSLTVPTIIFNNGALSSDESGNLTWNGQQIGGGTLDASGDITFTGLDAFTQYVTFNGGMISNGDIILNGSKLLLANGASVELYTGEDVPLPEGGSGSISPGTGNSGGSIDTSNFAKLNEDNTFTGNNNFTGNLTLGGNQVLTSADLSNYVTKANGAITSKLTLTNGREAIFRKNGARLYLCSVDDPDLPGTFILRCPKNEDCSEYVDLNGNKNGGLSWGGSPVVVLIASWSGGKNWYRKYSDGWIEQGGLIDYGSQPGVWNKSVSLNTSFASTNYNVVATIYEGDQPGDRYLNQGINITSLTTSSFHIYQTGGDAVQYITWYACGY